MKKIYILLLSLVCTLPALAQDKSTSQETKEKFTLQCGMLTTTKNNDRQIYSDHVTIKIPDKLEIEADSAIYDREKQLLVTYGTKKFSFSGEVAMNKQPSQICRYYLGTNLLTIE